jgi:hypothetical protein
VFAVRYEHRLQIKSRAIPVTDHGGLHGSETSRLPLCVDSQLTDGGKVSCLRVGLALLYNKTRGAHFFQSLSRPQGHSAAGRIRSIERFIDFIYHFR